MADETKDLSGIITNVRRSGTWGIELTLKMDDGEKKIIEWPVKLKNPLEIVPYQLAFLNQQVHYHFKRTEEHDCGLTGYSRTDTERVLTVFSGPLQGHKYESLE